MLATQSSRFSNEDSNLRRISMLQRAMNESKPAEEILRILATHTLVSYDCLYAFIAYPNVEGRLIPEASFDCEEDLGNQLGALSNQSDHPISLAMQAAHLICIASDSTEEGEEGMTAYVPLVGIRTKRRILVLGFKKAFPIEAQMEVFFEVIGQSLVTYFYAFDSSAEFVAPSSDQIAKKNTLEEINLSERQIKIAKMIADGFTNRQISRTLGYTEATIRYETIKLYERLRVRNRAQASSRIREILGV